MGLFVLLGLYASPSRLVEAVIPALVAGLVLVLVARPLSVLAAALPFRIPWREQVFLSWSGLRGAVPIVLALIAVTEGAPSARTLVDAVFVIVVVLTLVQGTTLPWVARLLGMSESAAAQELAVDAAPLDQLGADLLQVRIPQGSRMHGVYLRELRLPRGATVSLVVRGEEAFTPEVETRLREHDQLLVVTAAGTRGATEDRLRAVDRRGKLARWHERSGPQRRRGPGRTP
jgi:cell volume regulation protein A